ncbi:5-oxoprolinase subunit PxpB [Algoriphagus machipongonensis]|uniref:Allophanate hydrolase, subunit 1 n=1 Tax=Algoriphagus machipongonensis TaxID=388413 RepID=A3HS15_9BACT|nr:5-oxoprolinase subunit PxpB [Algoriphagus machipongonensis]EAZ82633.1 allophanate hydrolase, subunit 1 [Algoriphagus machipongonensis]
MKPKLFQITPILSEVSWDLPISDKLLQQQLQLKEDLQEEFKARIVETRMGFKTLSILWSKKVDTNFLEHWLSANQSDYHQIKLPTKTWQVPVCYSPSLGRDLESLAKIKDLKISELIEIHSSVKYRIHFYGFLPGFMYLEGLSKILHQARKSMPDGQVPAGSIAIGGSQTGIYPSESPGGWHLIGQTPIELFNPGKTPPVWAKPGEQIKFYSISLDEFDSFKQESPHPKWIE